MVLALAFANFFGNKFVIISGTPKDQGVEAGGGELATVEKAEEETKVASRRPKAEATASGVIVRRPKLEASRVEVGSMEDTTYSTIFPLNSTLRSVEHDLHRPQFAPGVVPAPPPPPPQSIPGTSSSVRVAARIEPAPAESSTVSSEEIPYCTALMEARERILNRSQNGQRRVKQGIFFCMKI